MENNVEFITGAVLSGILYDMLKHQVSLTAGNIKEKLQGWLIDDSIANTVEVELAKLQLSNEMSESAIAKKLDCSDELTAILKKIKPTTQTTIIQTHSGTGDNVAGNKTINH